MAQLGARWAHNPEVASSSLAPATNPFVPGDALKYQFIGQSELFYPTVFVDGRSLLAKPGDQHEFDEPPGSDWVAVPAPAPKRDKPGKENQA